jgi:hypothetical protein
MVLLAPSDSELKILASWSHVLDCSLRTTCIGLFIQLSWEVFDITQVLGSLEESLHWLSRAWVAPVWVS